MADEPKNTPDQSEYAQRLAEALAANRKEQDDITAQLERLAALQDHLSQLREDEAWLARSVQAAHTVVAPAEAAPGPAPEAQAPEAEQSESSSSSPSPAEASVPEPRQRTRAKAAKPKSSAKKTSASKAAAETSTPAKPAAKKATAKRAAAAKPAAQKAPAGKPTQPLLHELVMGILLQTPGEPHLAGEVRSVLVEKHPERATSVQTVRNTLDRLAKQKKIEKTNQQGSAMYTAPAPGAEAPVSEAGQGSEPASEQVPAPV